MGVTATVWSALPVPVRQLVKAGRRGIKPLAFRGSAVECPLCERTFSRFASFNGRDNARCPSCESLERHRMMWLFFQSRTDLFTGRSRVLHIAPEWQLERWLRARSDLDYVTADLLRKDVDLRLDVTRPELPDESFDVVLCSHVLEHVDDDRLAMRELRRITKSSGWAILTAPVSPEMPDTYEDWTITSEAGRLAAFGQEDHVRVYGRTFPDLLRAEGWKVDVRPMPLSADASRRYGVPEHEQDIYFAQPSG